MKKHMSLVFVALLTVSVSATKKPKIEGDKNVVLSIKEITGDFNVIEIGDGLEVKVSLGATNGYRLNADSNLHNVIRLEVIDGTLKVYATDKITKSKKLELEITVTQLEKLILKEDAKAIGQGRFSAVNFSIIGFDSSKFEIDVMTDDLLIDLRQNAGGKLSVRAKSIGVALNGRTDLKAVMESGTIRIDMDDSSEFTVEGDADDANFNLGRTSKLNARNMRVKTAKLTMTNASDVYVHATNSIGIDAKGKSNIYVYGRPEVDVKKLNDKAKIIKK